MSQVHLTRFQSQRLRYEPKLVVDYVSPDGPKVTAVRGILIQSRIKQLEAHGHLEDYVALLPEDQRELVLQGLAASWLPFDTFMAHFNALEGLRLNDAMIAAMSEPMGAGLFDMMFAGLIRVARNSGAEIGVWMGLQQSDRVFSRMYQGGFYKVTQVGPKDAIVEVGGMPFAQFRYFRTSHCCFMRGIFSFSTRACVCKPLPAGRGAEDALAVSLSWV